MTSLHRPDDVSDRPSRSLRVVPPPVAVDTAAAERAATDFLRALGVSTDDENVRATPGRMARAYAELFSAKEFDLTTFPNDEGYDELVLARSIPLRAVCEHHLLPFIGVAHVGYLPGERILGLSKLARVVGHFSARPQVQERLTTQVAGWLEGPLEPRGGGGGGVGGARGRGRDRGRAHVHDAAWGTGEGSDHGHLGSAWRAARGRAV